MGLDASQPPQELSAAIGRPGETLASGTLAGDFAAQDDPHGERVHGQARPPPDPGRRGDLPAVPLPPGAGLSPWLVHLPAVETTWDDAIPLRMDGYDGYGGIYQGDLNFEMYWDDTSLGAF